MSRAASIRQRLLNIAKQEGVAFQTIIIRYLHERLLYRLSRSPYRENFFLKGGVLLYAFNNEVTRPTKDVDFLGLNIPGDLENIRNVFQEICSIEDDDAVSFQKDTISVEVIKEDDKYEGVRLVIEGGFDSVKQRLQVDVGFGDVIIPEPQNLSYPLLLTDNNEVNLLVYSVESIIAEKVHAMVVLSLLNSRMKDFYDVFYLLKNESIDKDQLEESIVQTFQKRDTKIGEEVTFFSDSFASDEQLIKRWDQFLKRNKLSHPVSFEETVQFIADKILPVWQKYGS